MFPQNRKWMPFFHFPHSKPHLFSFYNTALSVKNVLYQKADHLIQNCTSLPKIVNGNISELHSGQNKTKPKNAPARRFQSFIGREEMAVSLTSSG